MRNGFDTQDTLSFESYSSSLACDMEEVSSESLRKMQDKEETTSEASWTAVTRGKGKDAWRLEPEGEEEKPEVTVLWNEAEGGRADTSKHHEKGKTRSSDSKRRAYRNAPGEEGEEIQSQKKKVIRVESEETQDYVRESLDLSRDEAEEICFVPGAISIPQRPMFWCDNRCSEEKPSVSGGLLR